VERRGDRAALDPKRLRDELIVEICVVAEEHDEALPLRERGDHRPHLPPVLDVAVRYGLQRVPVAAGRTPFLNQADVDQSPPQPAVQILQTMQVTS
jgi:hypothetical protein